MDLSENIQFNYDKILRFLGRSRSGYIFAMADDYRFIRQINNDLEIDLQKKEMNAGILFLNGKSDEPLLYQIKQHTENNQALIIANLYEIINDEATGRNNLSHLNFSREEIHDLAIPLLFWADKKSISIITNYAPDLFSQRSLTTIHFTGQVEHPVEEVMEKEDWKEFISSDKFKKIEAKIETLKRRLHDAEAAGYQPLRIAGEMALPLAREYAELGSKEKAQAVLSRYQPFIKEDNSDQLTQLARIYYYLHDYTQAIFLLQQANTILENKELLPDTWLYNNIQIADWLKEYGKLSEAMRLLQKAENILEKSKDKYSETIVNHIISLITERLGDIAQQSGNLQEAKRDYEQSLQVRKDLAAANPHSEELKRDLGVSYERLGDIAQQSGNLQEAKRYYEQSLQAREDLAAANPHSEELKRDLGISYERLGDIARQSGNLQEAKRDYEQGVQVREDLAAANPHSEELKRDLGISYERLGDIARQSGNLQEAKRDYEQGVQVREDLAAANPHSEELKRDLGISYERLGDIARQSGNLQEAKRYYEQSLQIGKDLAVANPHSEELKRDLGISYNKLGDIARQSGNLQEAKRDYEQSLQIGKDLAAANPHSEELKRDLGISYFKFASIAEAEKQFAQAFNDFSNVLSIFQSLSAANPLSQALKDDIQVIEKSISQLQQRQPAQE